MASDKGERINLVGKIVIAGVAWQSHRQNCHCEEHSDVAISED
jgi:hypothetical protein